EDGAEEALADPPLRPGEVVEARARRQHERVEALPGQQLLRPGQPRLALVEADGRDTLRHRLQLGDRGRNLPRRGGTYGRSGRPERGASRELQQLAASDGHVVPPGMRTEPRS